MTATDQIKQALDYLDEEQKQALLVIIHTWKKDDDDTYDENGEVIVDEFYQKMLDNIDPDDEGIAFTEAELREELGI